MDYIAIKELGLNSSMFLSKKYALWLLPLLIVLNFYFHVTTYSLGVRLFANMLADTF